jgi:hypothetical protein
MGRDHAITPIARQNGRKNRKEILEPRKTVWSVARSRWQKAVIDDAHYSLRQVRVEDELF